MEHKGTARKVALLSRLAGLASTGLAKGEGMRQVRAGTLLIAVVAVLGVASTTSASITASEAAGAKVTMPNVIGMRMDRATRLLRSIGLRVNEECDGLLGCIIKSNWYICGQAPKAGRKVNRGSVVVIFGVRRGDC